MDRPQVIVDAAGQPAFAVIPWEDYERLTGEADALLTDEQLYDRAKSEGGESFPVEVLDRLLDGQNPGPGLSPPPAHVPIRVGRSLWNKCQLYLSQIERGKRSGSTKTLAAIAQALNVTVDDLL